MLKEIWGICSFIRLNGIKICGPSAVRGRSGFQMWARSLVRLSGPGSVGVGGGEQKNSGLLGAEHIVTVSPGCDLWSWFGTGNKGVVKMSHTRSQGLIRT